MYCVSPLLEPEIIESELNQTMPEIILNLNSSVANKERTIDIDLPRISMNNGPFRLVCIIYEVNKMVHVNAYSHIYIIVVINGSGIDVNALTTQELLNHSMDNSMLYYIAAVINASQYVQYADGYRMRYALGAGDNTTDVYRNMFHNREVKREYSFFYRVFSANSTPEVHC